MIKRNLILCVSFALLVFAQQGIASPAAGASDSVRTMATILKFLNHFPDDDGKAKLNKIIGSSDALAAEKTVASAILNLQHSASSSDKKKLSKVMADNSASQPVRDLANIVHSLNHKPSSSDKAILKKYSW